MIFRNLAGAGIRLSMALVLTVFLGAMGSAQIGSQSADSARHAEREAYFSKLRERQNDTTGTKTGWLILEGRFVEPPYSVEVTDSSVTVNGLDVFREKSKQQPENIQEPRSSESPPYTVINGILSKYKEERETIGVEIARKNVLESLLHHDIIDTAYFSSEELLRFRKVGDEYEEELWLRAKPDTSLLNRSKHVQSKLQVYASRLAIPLNEGALVIKEGGYGISISYPESETALKQLREAVSSISDFAERKKRIQEIIGNEKYAEKIAREFK